MPRKPSYRPPIRGKLRCKTCGAEHEHFNGWAFCGPCRPEQHGKPFSVFHHDWTLLEPSTEEPRTDA